MDALPEPWALVLAAGEGRRLCALTTDRQGKSIPKQFCSLNGEASLLQLALHRAARVVPWSRITTIVAAQHESLWHGELPLLASRNVVVQPSNRGTGIGVLTPLLCILERDPEARMLVLPSDHYVFDEQILCRAIRRAVAEVARRPQRVVLLGITPDEPETGYGWIVPAGPREAEVRPVLRFVEKPPPAVADELMHGGGVWNSFILVAQGRLLLEMFRRRDARVVDRIAEALVRDRRTGGGTSAVASVYKELADLDFSRDVLEGFESRLSLLTVPFCGWTDLGTPQRVARCVERMPRKARPLPRGPVAPARPDLAEISLRQSVGQPRNALR